jgi:glutamine amidotransferase
VNAGRPIGRSRTPRIAVLDLGIGNLRSVARALERVGGRAIVTAARADAAAADALVVPGVGASDACVRALRATGLDASVRDAVSDGRWVFGICLGLQVLLEGSDEGGEPGLGLFAGRARRLPSTVRVPHVGWNEVRWTRDHVFVRGIPDGTKFSFAHSYAMAPDAATIGVTEHGVLFASTIASGSLFATQFHPEKSGDAGLAMYEAFVQEVASCS